MSSVAKQFGFSATTLWNHVENVALKLKRNDLNVLLPGDVVVIPEKQLREEPAATDRRHRYQLKGAVKLKLRLLRNGEPRSSDAYVLNINSKLIDGVTDNDGHLEASIPADAEAATLTFPASGDTFSLRLGHLNPVKEVSGIQARLRGLGFYIGEITGAVDEPTKSAIAAFQLSENLPQSGEPDQPTQDALKSAFGS